MELKRSVRVWIAFALLIFGNNATAVLGRNLDCTNDFEKFLSCHIEAQNCTEYSLTLVNHNGIGVDSGAPGQGCSPQGIDHRIEPSYIFKQCDNGQCCCSAQQDRFYSGDDYTAKVWKRDIMEDCKVIDITASIKPKTPTIISVNESNGNFQVVWLKNMKDILSKTLKAEVTYHVKGDTHKEPKFVDQTTDGETNDYEILGRDLKPSTTYVVSVKSFTEWSGKYSDSSEEYEFTTPMSSNTVFLALIICLSVAAVIISSAIFGCYVKFKTKWWDKVLKCPNPKLLNMLHSEHEILKPMPPILSSICVEPLSDDGKLWLKDSLRDSSSGSLQQSSGISTGSSCLSYANTEPVDIIAEVQDALSKAFANICPISPLNINLLAEDGLTAPNDLCDVMADTSSGSSCFMNKTYSILIPGCTQTDSSEVQAEMLCDSVYHPCEGVTVSSTYQQAPACPLVMLPAAEVSSFVSTDMSYQPCNADSGSFSYAEDSGSSSLSSGTNTTAQCGLEPRLDEEIGVVEQVTVCDENPCYGSLPADKQSFPAVDYDYQPFPNVVEQPGILFSEKKSDDKEDTFIKMPQGILNPVVPCPINMVQDGQCLSELQRPFLSLVSAEQSMPVITDSGYQCV